MQPLISKNNALSNCDIASRAWFNGLYWWLGARPYYFWHADTNAIFRNYFASIPQELFKAARVDGAGFWQIYFQIMLPMALPIFVVAIILQVTSPSPCQCQYFAETCFERAAMVDRSHGITPPPPPPLHGFEPLPSPPLL